MIETSRGKDEGITYLDVEEQPPLIDAPDRLLVSPGQTAELKEPFRYMIIHLIKDKMRPICDMKGHMRSNKA